MAKLSNKGLSLIELLVSMAIMGIVSSMIAVILSSGTNYFRKQSYTIGLHNDSQLISTSMTNSILMASDCSLKTGVSVGSQMNCTVFSTGGDKGKTYIYAPDSRSVYVYNGKIENINSLMLSKGNCLSFSVQSFTVAPYAYDSTGALEYCSEATDIEYIEISYTLKNTQSEVTQSFNVKPRNSVVPLNKVTVDDTDSDTESE